MKIIKKNASEVSFNKQNILESISKANNNVSIDNRVEIQEMKEIIKTIEQKCKNETHILNTNDISEMVEEQLMLNGKFKVAKEYITYRYQKYLDKRKNTTDDRILSLLKDENEEIQQENANKNPTLVYTQRDYIAGEVSKDIAKRYLIPADISQAHSEGIIHFHDTDYFAQPIHNCCVWNLEDILQNGTVINETKIEKPHTFLTAATITSQVSAIIASSQYGGQTFKLLHLAPFVEETRKYFRNKFKEELPSLTEEQLEELVEKETRRNIKDGIQTLQYQLLTISSTNGQTPFVSIFMYLNETNDEKLKSDLALIIEEVLKQRIQGIKNKNGEIITNAFPKLLYVLEEDNIHESSKYYYLTKLAAECTAKRMVPDYISEKIMKEWKKDKKGKGYCFPCMGCRSFLSLWTEPKNKKIKIDGRFNKGVVTINLPYIALESRDKNGQPNLERFWYMLSERLELCHRALRLRHEHLVGVKSDVAPILWQHGALARLKSGETIDSLLTGGYSTISLGYVGLWETVKILTNENIWDENGHEIAVKIMKKLKDSCDMWDSVEHIGYSVYGTPEESTTYKFAQALQRRFGNNIKDITDKNYVTNSYHVPVWFGLEDGMDCFRKIEIETEFQKYSTGGAISYIETPNMQNNIPAIIDIMKYIYDNIVYCEINNMGSCHCGNCNTDGNVTLIADENKKLKWHCNNCGNEDKSKLTCVVRVCGYLSQANEINQGRLADIKNRKTHI